MSGLGFARGPSPIRSVEASSGQEAFEIGRKLFPGCRLAGVVREGGEQQPEDG